VDRRLRIGELARRTHVTPDVLRAWERRYGLLQPERSDGGYRLYSSTDEDRVRAMVRHLNAGVAAGEAARLVLEERERAGVESAWLPGLSAELRQALDRFDEAGTQEALDKLIATLSLEAAAREVILPYLRELGERWERGEVSVAQEHFAAIVLRARLLGLARGWDRGMGPRAVLACAPGERHELGLIVFGLLLRQHGWRVTYLGADTPLDTLAAATRELAPAAVVVVALAPDGLTAFREPLTQLARSTRLLLAGAGARSDLAAAVGAELLPGDPVEAAAGLATEAPPQPQAERSR
jgi:DNA-binding transcriptional MerR regulator/methylmalonyl-CoA mutase cobalamin-binding subunit